MSGVSAPGRASSAQALSRQINLQITHARSWQVSQRAVGALQGGHGRRAAATAATAATKPLLTTLPNPSMRARSLSKS